MADKIKCPNCHYEFDIEEALSDKLKSHFEKEFEKKLQEQNQRIDNERKQLEVERLKLAKQEEQQQELLKREVARMLKLEKERIEESTRETFEEKLKSLEEENERRKTENKSLRVKEVALLQKEKALQEQQEELKLQMEEQLIEKQNEIEEKVRGKEREAFELERRKLLKQIEDNKNLAEEMRRKAEQGSMQLQGEVQELALEELLEKIYPFDKIEEVPKGVRGADCIQTVINNLQQETGTIVYESKRTKNFAKDWIDKLKQDQVACKADIAVLVTETFPSDMDRFGEKEGIWICGFHEVKSLSFVLREMLIKTHSVKKSEENKGDRMELLYNYLTSNEFVQNIKRIVENYDAMINQLNSEKKAMYKIWNTREKQIWVVQENISALFGSIKGIAGKELETSSVMELPDKEIED